MLLDVFIRTHHSGERAHNARPGEWCVGGAARVIFSSSLSIIHSLKQRRKKKSPVPFYSVSLFFSLSQTCRCSCQVGGRIFTDLYLWVGSHGLCQSTSAQNEQLQKKKSPRVLLRRRYGSFHHCVVKLTNVKKASHYL